MTKYEIAVRLLAEYCDCPSKDGVPIEIPEEWCEKHCDYRGDAAEETVKCWEKVISDRYEAQDEEDKTEEELKPCPFCGGEAAVMDMGYPHWVYCKNCGAKVHGRTTDEKDSIKAWNRRASDEQSGSD